MLRMLLRLNFIDLAASQKVNNRVSSTKKTPECTKSYSKLNNVSASKDQNSRKQRLMSKPSNKRKLRPSSHRRVLRRKNMQETDVSHLVDLPSLL